MLFCGRAMKLKLLLSFLLCLIGGTSFAQKKSEIEQLKREITKNYVSQSVQEFVNYSDSMIIQYPKLKDYLYNFCLRKTYDNLYLDEALGYFSLVNQTDPSFELLKNEEISKTLKSISDRYLQAKAYYNRKDYYEAESLLRSVCQELPYFWQVYYYQHICLDSMGKTASADSVLNLGVYSTSHPDLMLLRAKKRNQNEHYEEAYNDLNYLILNGYEHAPAYFERGKSLLYAGYYDSALVDFQRGFALDPQTYEYLPFLADYYVINDNYDAAYLNFQAAIKRGIALNTRHRRQLLLSALKTNKKTGTELFYSLIEESPQDTFLYELYIEENLEIDTIIKITDLALKQMPKNIKLFARRAFTIRSLDPNHPQYRKDFLKMMDMDSTNMDQYKDIHASMYFFDKPFALEVRNRAKKYMQLKLEQDSSSAKNWSDLGDAYSILHSFKEKPEIIKAALRFYDKAIELDSSNPDYLIKRGTLSKDFNAKKNSFLSDYKAALQLKEDWDIRKEYILELIYSGQSAEAEKELTACFGLYGEKAEYYRVRATLYRITDRLDLAKEDERTVRKISKEEYSLLPPPPPPPQR